MHLQEVSASHLNRPDLFVMPCFWKCSALARNVIHKISHCSGKRFNNYIIFAKSFRTAEARFGFLFAYSVKIIILITLNYSRNKRKKNSF